MKLVEILARGLEKWECENHYCTQEDDGSVWSNSEFPYFDSASWCGGDYQFVDNFKVSTDCTTAIITKEMWEEEKERIKCQS